MKFTTIGNAKKLTKLSYLGSVASSSKIAKGLKYNEMTYILYLAPASQSGYNVCPMSTEECRTACLTESGHNRIDVKKNNINKARIAKTKLLRNAETAPPADDRTRGSPTPPGAGDQARRTRT